VNSDWGRMLTKTVVEEITIMKNDLEEALDNSGRNRLRKD